MLAKVLGALRGDKYMVGAYRSPAAGSHDGIAPDRAVDADGTSRSAVAEPELPVHVGSLSRDRER